MKNKYSTFLLKCAAIMMTGSLLSGCGPASEPAVPAAPTEVTEAAVTEDAVTEDAEQTEVSEGAENKDPDEDGAMDVLDDSFFEE